MYKARKIIGKLQKHISKKEYTIIIGARQTGKTTLLKKLYSEIDKQIYIAHYMTFEYPRVLA